MVETTNVGAWLDDLLAGLLARERRAATPNEAWCVWATAWRAGNRRREHLDRAVLAALGTALALEDLGGPVAGILRARAELHAAELARFYLLAPPHADRELSLLRGYDAARVEALLARLDRLPAAERDA